MVENIDDSSFDAEIRASWREPTLDEIAVAQGIIKPQKFDELLGAGKDLWTTDNEFESFVNGVYERRQGEYKKE